MRHPNIVIFGRANVGKSTLFNRLIERPKALTSPVAGTTRNVNADVVYWNGVNFTLIDTGGIESVLPKKKLKKMLPVVNADFAVDIIKQTQRELKRADLVIFVVDLHTGLVPEDRELARHLKTMSVPVVLVGNKADGKASVQHREQLPALGLGEAVFVSAKNGMGTGDLLDAVITGLPKKLQKQSDFKYEAPDSIKVSFIGRPNVGKSSLLNAIVGEERVIVSPIPHTTRESYDTIFEYEGKKIQLVDTAGLRRGAKVAPHTLERTGMRKSIISAQQSDICLLIVDISQPLTVQDSHLAQMITEKRRGIIIVANKWDLMKGQGPDFVKQFDETLRRQLKFLDYAPILHVSAATGERAPKLLEHIDRVAASRRKRVKTHELNKLVERISLEHPPQSPTSRHVRILYAAQTAVAPPNFVFFTNIATSFHFSYERFLVNQLREAFGFVGTPIRLQVRARRRKGPERGASA